MRVGDRAGRSLRSGRDLRAMPVPRSLILLAEAGYELADVVQDLRGRHSNQSTFNMVDSLPGFASRTLRRPPGVASRLPVGQ